MWGKGRDVSARGVTASDRCLAAKGDETRMGSKAAAGTRLPILTPIGVVRGFPLRVCRMAAMLPAGLDGEGGRARDAD